MVAHPIAPCNPSADDWTAYTPQTPIWLRLEAQGQLFKISHVERFVAWYERPAPPTRQRGDITEFSRRSRKRLLDTFARLDVSRLRFGTQRPKFITLTYQKNMRDAVQAKRDLDAFMKRLARRSNDFWAIWRMEFQKRGSIHFHLITHTPYWDAQSAQKAWNEVNGEDSPNSLDIEALRSFQGVMSYAAKYLGKVEDESPDESPEAPESCLGLSMLHTSPQTWTGRHWGVYGREHIPFAKRVTTRVTVTLETLIEWATNHPSPWAHPMQGCTIYGDALAQLMRFRESWMSHQEENTVWTVVYREKQNLTRDEFAVW